MFTTLPDHDAGLTATLQALRPNQRRQLLKQSLLTAAVLSPFVSNLAHAACSVIPTETAGPFPGDGTNGPNSLTQSGIVRRDIRASFGSAGTAQAAGVPLTVTLNLVNTNANCGSLAGYAVYLWHCDAVGNYSMYSGGASTQNYLRGVQVSDASGAVSFTTIYPGCYDGRWPHMHFEIFTTVADASTGRNAVRTSQLALPEATSLSVYTEASATYPSSRQNLAATSLTRDGVFSNDAAATQLVTVNGSVASGYNAVLQVGIAGSTAPVTSNASTVEFYNSNLDHYVMVTDPNEVAAITSGSAGPGWSRTGKVFEFEAAPAPNSLTVHRFYGSITPGPNSHFYTISEAEKAQLLAIAAATPSTQARWNYEASGGFKAGALTAANACLVNSANYTVPVYRLYNNGPAIGKDSNHRYTTSLTTATEMQVKGWVLEGVVFCALK
jgi:protocatechuate 3,4-dioxygenase beta subunit